MASVEVSIQGIVMLVAATIYPQNTGTNPAVALATKVTAHSGTFGVMLPAHKTVFRIQDDGFAGQAPPRFSKVLNEPWLETELRSERVQFGEWRNGGCVPTPGFTATYDRSASALPNLGNIVDSTTLHSEILPTQLGIPASAAVHLSGWLDMSAGTVSAVGIDAFVSEFRPPSTLEQALARKALWKFLQASPCIVISPLSGSGTTTEAQLNDSLPVLSGQFLNTAVDPTHTGHRRGTAYHFELLYDLLQSPPKVPPLPYMVLEIDPNTNEIHAKAAGPVRLDIDASTGIDCGPGTNGKPRP